MEDHGREVASFTEYSNMAQAKSVSSYDAEFTKLVGSTDALKNNIKELSIRLSPIRRESYDSMEAGGEEPLDKDLSAPVVQGLRAQREEIEEMARTLRTLISQLDI